MSHNLNPALFKAPALESRIYTGDNELSPAEQIRYQVFKYGYYHDPIVGKLRPKTVSRGILIGIIAAFIFIFACIPRSGQPCAPPQWQAQALKSQAQVIQLRQALVDQQETASVEQVRCINSLAVYESRMNQIEQQVQAVGPANPDAAIAMALIKFLKAAHVVKGMPYHETTG